MIKNAIIQSAITFLDVFIALFLIISNLSLNNQNNYQLPTIYVTYGRSVYPKKISKLFLYIFRYFVSITVVNSKETEMN